MYKNFLVLAFLTVSLGGCGGGGSSSTTTTTTTSDNNSAGTVTISGAATTIASAAPGFKGTAARRAFASASVGLYQISPDGTATQVSIGTVTTDASGNYSIPNVPVPTTGTGAATDFYYEVRVTDGATTVAAPVAPAANTTVDVNPETDLAAKVLSDVADVPGMTALPTPSADLIEAVRRQVADNAVDLATSGALDIPAAGAATAVASANGLAAGGGNAEKMYKAVQFESEAIGLAADATTTASEAAAYLKRVTREGCNQAASGNPLPAAAAEVLGAAFLTDATYTAQQVIAAYNANGGTVDAAAKISQFATMLTSIDTKLAATTDSGLTAAEQIALFAKRDLTGSAFGSSTALNVDQAVSLLQSLSYDQSQTLSQNNRPCNAGNIDMTHVIASLTNSSDLTAAKIADAEIYHDSGFGCDANAGKGHFRADIDVYVPTGVVDSVTIASTDTAALNSGSVTLTRNGSRWQSNTDGVCVNMGTSVTYTITAVTTGGNVNSTVTRNHPNVPEAMTTINGGTPTLNGQPNVFTVKRPVYSWESPATKLASIAGAPSDSAVKYTYEFSHVAVQGHSLAGGPLSQCGQNNAFGERAMYSVSSFIPSVDCDPAACAAAVNAAQGSTVITEGQINCRMNIQTYLVDAYDRLLGQAAGHFREFCIDSNGDGDCGI